MSEVLQHSLVGLWRPCLSFGPDLIQSEVSLILQADVSVQAQAWAGMNSACGHADR